VNVRRIGSGVFAALVLLLGCSFDASGDGTAGVSGSMGDASQDGSDTGNEAGTDPTTAVSGDTASTGSADGEMLTDTSSDVDGPMLRISHGPTHDYGFVPLHDVAPQTFEVVNTGARAATSIAPHSLQGPFSFRGGSYPGAGGSCAHELAAGDTCTVVIEFSPAVPKLHETVLVLEYQGLLETLESTRRLMGGGIVENLIVNGGAEQGGSPPAAWSVATGDDWAATDCGRATPQSAPLSGNFCLGHVTMAGGEADDLEETAIEQTFALVDWADAIDRAELRFALSGAARSRYAENDQWRVWVEFLDAGHNPLESLYDSGWRWTEDWELLEGPGVAPSGTRHVRVRLMCRITFQPSLYCDAFFDDMVLAAIPNEP
jgi:hypothetical protein